MTDKELLELAAKAAGIDIDWDGDRALTKKMFRGHLENWMDWNPLTDDGDALRLAVKLNMDIGLDCPSVCIELDGNDHWITEPWGNDPYAATRRAIVRAAATIGKDK